jgi:peroxiredoxin Q/BCP
MSNKNWFQRLALLLSFSLPGSPEAKAEPLMVGQKAPEFSLKTQDNADLSLAGRRGSWTVLYFYPKADTPGCTKQACTYRDAIQKIREEGADVFGVSTDSVQALKDFHSKYHLTFTLLSDENGKITEAYGAKMPLINISKRWTFIVDPEGLVRDINTDVDPAADAAFVAKRIQDLKKSHP